MRDPERKSNMLVTLLSSVLAIEWPRDVEQSAPSSRELLRDGGLTESSVADHCVKSVTKVCQL